MSPPVVADDRTTRALLAVVAGATTLDEVASATGLTRGIAHTTLHRLRALGFVTFKPRAKRTLRPAVTAHRPTRQEVPEWT